MRELKIAGYMAAIIIVVLGLFWHPEDELKQQPVLVSTSVEKMLSVNNIHIETTKPEDLPELYRTTEGMTSSKAKTETEPKAQKKKIAPAQLKTEEQKTEEATTEEVLPEKKPLYEYEEHKSTSPDPVTETEQATEEEYTEEYIEQYTEQLPEEETEAPAETEADVEQAEENMTYFCSSDLTAYIWTGNPCSNGNYPTVGYTVACNGLPFGTKVYLPGYGYRIVEDRGDMKGYYDIDLFVGSYDEAINIGRRTVDVYIVQ